MVCPWLFGGVCRQFGLSGQPRQQAELRQRDEPAGLASKPAKALTGDA